MTVHKAMYGIDPILSEKIYLQDLAEKNKKILILFDESDQAAVAMRTAIIDQSIENAGGSKRFAKGYNGYLQYKDLIDNPEQIANEYYGELLEKSLLSPKGDSAVLDHKVDLEIIVPLKSAFFKSLVYDYINNSKFCEILKKLKYKDSCTN